MAMALNLLNRIGLIILLVIYWLIFPVYQLGREIKWSWNNWTWTREMRNEMADNWPRFIHDFKTARIFESKEAREKRNQAAMDDL